MICMTLFFEFFKVGLFAVGGGMSSIPFLMELARRYPWLTLSELTNMIAISESTPGPIGVNCATYVGYHAAGIPGALTATLGLVLPSFLIISVISYFFHKYKDSRIVQSVFKGIRPAVCALICYAVLQILKVTVFAVAEAADAVVISAETFRLPALLLILALFGVMQIPKLKKTHPLAWIAAGAVLGIVLKL